MTLQVQGDSGIVQLFAAHAGGVASQVALGDKSTNYKMNRLLRLGATGTYARELDLISDDYENGERIDGSSERGLITYESKAWAQQMYDQYFSSSPPGVLSAVAL